MTRELPNNVPYPAKVALIKDFQRTWGQLCQDVFGSVSKEFHDILTEIMRQRFQRYTLLHSRVKWVFRFVAQNIPMLIHSLQRSAPRTGQSMQRRSAAPPAEPPQARVDALHAEQPLPL